MKIPPSVLHCVLRPVLVAVFFPGVVLPATVHAEEAGGGIVWERVIPELEKIKKLEDRHDNLPRWSFFGTTRKENSHKIEKLLDDTVEILGISPTSGLRAEIAELEETNREDEQRIAQLREKRVSAPDESLIGNSVEKIDAEIGELREVIRRREREIEDKKDRFAGEVAEMGLDLSRDQVDFLLATVIGDSVIDIGIAFFNVKLITRQLEQLTSESLESMEIARRYYGMYTVLLRSLMTMYGSALLDIDEKYLVEIESIRSRTRELMQDTKALRRSADPSHKAALESNIRAQEFTMEAAETYRDYLEQQRQGIIKAQEKLRKDLAVAVNTYETVKISGDLLRVMRASDELFELLFDLQVPELRPFENLEMQREFEKLTTQLRRQ